MSGAEELLYLCRLRRGLYTAAVTAQPYAANGRTLAFKWLQKKKLINKWKINNNMNSYILFYTHNKTRSETYIATYILRI